MNFLSLSIYMSVKLGHFSTSDLNCWAYVVKSLLYLSRTQIILLSQTRVVLVVNSLINLCREVTLVFVENSNKPVPQTRKILTVNS